MAWVLLAVAGLIVALPTLLYPAALRLAAALRPAPVAPTPRPGRATVVVAFTGGGPLLAAKVSRLAAVAAASGWQVDTVLAGDGPIAEADRRSARAAAGDMPVTLCALDAPAGKAAALNLGAGHATGDVLVFSDLDADLADDALATLCRWFAEPSVGAVCGRRQIVRDGGPAVAAAGQRAYTDLDSRIKLLENRLGAITSNDGKLYAMRRSLFRPIHPAATDDLYNALTVVAQGYRVLFEPAAVARIPSPAWTVGHDLRRRRRVTLRGLTGLFARPRLLLAPRFGLFGPRLIVNKLLRRCLPVAGLLVLLALLLLAPAHAWAGWLIAAALLGGLGTAAYAPLARRGVTGRLPAKADKLWASAFYAGLGMLGMLLGLVDFLRGKRVVRWAPRKAA
ncbi:glycosyltransferase [Rhodovibrio sodomensis]|uniref:glycosyltransferase n=1 Tax=Rhodovibrio sodomensis TaxID=1088 RepID=UPI001907A475